MSCKLTALMGLAVLCCSTAFSATATPTVTAADFSSQPVAVMPAEIADMLRVDYDGGLIESFAGRQCEINCPPGGRLSVEPNCAADYVDATNGGCNTTPPLFETLVCGDTICGTAGTFDRPSAVPPTRGRDLDWYRFTITTNTVVRWTVRAEFNMQQFLQWDSNPSPTDSCPGITLFVVPATTAAAAVPPCTDSTIRAWVPAGQYFGIVGPRNATITVPCDAEYQASLTCEAAGACEIDCAPGATVSTEPPCGEDYIDETDGGCNTTPTAFGRVACGETVCGTLGSYVFAGAPGRRDLDWYRLTLTVTSAVSVDIEADAPPLIILAGLVGTPPAYDPCQAQTVDVEPDAGDTADPCTIVNLTFQVNPGEYIVIASSRYFGAIPCGDAEYNMTVTCQPVVVPCVPLTCPPGGQISDEPLCGPGYIDEYNPGCNGTPPCLSDPDPDTGVPGDPTGDDCFESAACGDIICGKVGAYPRDGGSFRDLDWYEIITTVPCTIRARATATFASVVFLIDGSQGCPPPPSLDVATGAICEEALAEATVLPGTYWVAISSQGFGGVNCTDADYVLSIECECQAPCTLSCPPGYRTEGEPPCGPEYVDVTNPGCNGTPPAYTDLTCPSDRICGTVGNYTRGGTALREQDWLRLNIASQTQITWRFTCAFPGVALLLNVADCTAPVGVGDPVTVNPCQEGTLTACLDPGTYAILMQPQGFVGVPCGALWFGELTCGPCPSSCGVLQRGDSDNSGGIDFNDINCFVPALISLAAWEGCPQAAPITGLANYTCRNDVNCSGAVDFDDIGTFVTCLVGGACPTTPPCTP